MRQSSCRPTRFSQQIVSKSFANEVRPRDDCACADELTMRPDFSRLVGKISEAGFAPEAWPEFLESLTGALGVAGAACIIANKKTRRVDWVCFSGLSAEFRSDYVNYYAALDPFSPLLNIDVGWMRLSESLPDTILRKSEWYNDFVLSCPVACATFLGLVSSRHRLMSRLLASINRSGDGSRTRPRRSWGS